VLAVVPDEWGEEILFVDPMTTSFEVLRPDVGGWSRVDAGDDGWTPLESLGVALCTVGGRLQVQTDTGVEEV